MTNAINTVCSPVNGNWLYRFSLRGREYTIVPGGPSTTGYDATGDYIKIRVFGSPRRDITIRPNSPLVPLSYYSNASGIEFPV